MYGQGGSTRLRAEGGDPSAQFELGMMYYYGVGVKANMRKGLSWLRKSASAGNFDAKYFLKALAVKFH